MKKKNLLFIGVCSLLLFVNLAGCKVDRMQDLQPIGTVDDGGGGGGTGTPPPVESIEVHNLRVYFASCANVDVSAITYDSPTDTFIRTATDNISHSSLLEFYNLSVANGYYAPGN